MTGHRVSAPRSLSQAERHPWVDHAVRAGMVAYGVVYLLIAWLALQLALGRSEGSANADGALHQLAEQPFGRLALWLVAVGMALLVLWRLLEAAAGHDPGDDGGDRARHVATSLLKAVLYAVIAVSAVQTATGSGGGGGTDSTTAQLMGLPGGQLIVGLVALGILGYAATQARQAWSEDFRDDLDAEGEAGRSGRLYVLAGKAGYVAKAVAVTIIGGLFAYAAITHDASKSGGLDQALRQVLQQPAGPVLLVLVAAGIGCYGLFCFARARHLSR